MGRHHRCRLHPSWAEKFKVVHYRIFAVWRAQFACGLAKNPCFKYILDEALVQEIKIPEDPQMVGAYGAAIIARDQLE
jgi:activator of 2-hydroxyglutaryl-CoA dehydratase